MSVPPSLTARHQKILSATIRHYVATAEPVGSRTLIEEYDFAISSATIRNAMGLLEKAGLLYQPHTSAGRVPSDWGYRLYVDQLLTPDQHIGKKIQQSFEKQLQSHSRSLETLIQKATKILAYLSGYIALITMPQTVTNQLRHLQLILVETGQVMLIVVTDNYQTQSFLIEQGTETLTEEELNLLSNFLNSKLRGFYLAELVNLNWTELLQEFQNYTEFLTTVLTELSYRATCYSHTPILMHGLSEILRQPEFSQPEPVQMLVELLEKEQEQLWPLIFQTTDLGQGDGKVKVSIGSENYLEPMRSCSLVSCVYRQGSIPIGSVAVLGPTRMLYENTIPLVESAADYLSEAFS